MNVVLASQAARQAPPTTYDTGSHVQGRSRNDYVIPTSTGARIRLNVRGMRFETYEQTLNQFPHTLLGSATKRLHFYDSGSDEYIIDRDRGAFDSILFFYQSGGILSRPEDIPEEMFVEELKYFEITKKVEEPQTSAVVQNVLPTNPIRRKIWQILEYPESSMAAGLFGKWSLLVIVLSLVTFCTETIPEYRSHTEIVCEMVSNNTSSNQTLPVCRTVRYGDYWFTVEIAYVTWFTFELVLRLIVSPDRLAFVLTPLGLVDIAAIIPFYITLSLQSKIEDVTSFPVLRILRLFRVVRILKLGRYSKGVQILAKTLKSFSKEIPSLGAMIALNLTLFSSIMYYAEKDVEETDFTSIPDAFWWGIITMTSVGYGDQVPKGVVGKFVGAFCALIGGILIMAFPSPILISSFEEVYGENEETEKKPETPPSNNKINISNELSELGSTVGEVQAESSGTGSDASDTALLSSRWGGKPDKLMSFSNNMNNVATQQENPLAEIYNNPSCYQCNQSTGLTKASQFLPPLQNAEAGELDKHFIQLDIITLNAPQHSLPTSPTRCQRKS